MYSKAPISVLITYYNEEIMLEECLKSLFQSTILPSEILIYDDCSKIPPNNFIPKDTEIPISIFREHKNMGPGYGRTKLLSLAKEEYIHFQDADDLFAPDWATRVQKEIEKSKADVILTGIKSINENGQILSEDVMGLKQIDTRPIDLIRFGLGGSILVPSTTCKRELLLQIGGYEPREVLAQSEDFHFHLKLGLLRPSVAIIVEPLVIQRIRKNSHSHSAGLLICYQSALKALNLLEPELIQNYKPELAQSYSRIGYSLYVLGDIKNARVAFKKAKELGLKNFPGRSKYFGILARIFGQELAEQISLMIQQYKKSK